MSLAAREGANRLARSRVLRPSESSSAGETVAARSIRHFGDGSAKVKRPAEPGLSQQFCSSGSYNRLGGFLPPPATKLTQSPWFLNTPKVCQPPFLH
jgi:hypothetical protein